MEPTLRFALAYRFTFCVAYFMLLYSVDKIFGHMLVVCTGWAKKTGLFLEVCNSRMC